MSQAVRILKTPVTLLALLLVLIGGGYWGYQALKAPVQKSANPCVMTDVGKELSPEEVTVRVLNAGTLSKRASLNRIYLNGHGFRVIYINNSEANVANTVIVGNSADSPEVRLVAQFYSGATTEGDGRTDHVVDVILTDASTQVSNPVSTVAVEGPVCLPPQKSASANPTGAQSPAATTPTKPTPSAKKK